MDSEAHEFPIVAIGVAARRLPAITELVGAIPPDTGMAFVIVGDVPEEQITAMPSAIPIEVLRADTPLKPDTIFAAPTGWCPSLNGSIIHASAPTPVLDTQAMIDTFLSALADARGPGDFAVLLSKAKNSDVQSARAIKARGGIIIINDDGLPADKAKPAGPEDAALADLALPVRDIPAQLVEIAQHRGAALGSAEPLQKHHEIEQFLPQITALLLDEEGKDFTQYKLGTLIRRVERRMALLRKGNIEAFIALLRQSATERASLAEDFLIGVTRFFRDEQPFDALRDKAIAELAARDAEPLRIWVPACSTGEEAYSIAMLVCEALEKAGFKTLWQIFGTDLDAAALRHARAGIFSRAQVKGISAERLERFFRGVEGGYEVKSEIRDRMIFASHNVLSDPPFSRIDLISCRNLMIYLDAEVQAGIITRFHYALNEKGYLFLGPSESLGGQQGHFTAIDRDARLFKRNDTVARALSVAAMSKTSAMRYDAPATRDLIAEKPAASAQAPSFEQQLLTQFAQLGAPPFAAINQHDEIVYISEAMAAYIRPPQGTPSALLDQYLTAELRLPVRLALQRARDSGTRAVETGIILSGGIKGETFDIEAVPLAMEEPMVLITLQPVRLIDPAKVTQGTANESDAPAKAALESDLIATRLQLNAATARYETIKRELKNANEELLSMNEELQSSNEELETTCEELQSINEEMETVNAELSDNNRQLLSANSDLLNLFNTTDIATIFLNDDLCVRRYTTSSQRLFGLRERDLGRPIRDLKWHIDYNDLEEDAARALATLQPVEREVSMPSTGETFLLAIRPYRCTDNRIDGSVLTLFDISEQKKTAEKLADNARAIERQYAELETLYDVTPVGLNLLDKDLRYLRINQRLAEINGLPVEDHIGRKQSELLPDIDGKIRDIQLEVLATGKPALGIEITGVTPAAPDVTRHWIVDYYPVRTEEGGIFAVGCCVNEVTKQKQMQTLLGEAVDALQESKDRLNFALDAGKLGAWKYDFATRKTERTLLHDQIFGHESALDEWDFETFLGYILEPERGRMADLMNEAIAKRASFTSKFPIERHGDGAVRWLEITGKPEVNADGKLVSFGGVIADITERKDAESLQKLLLNELQHRVKNTLATTLAILQFSARKATNVDEFSKTLRDRIYAIARTHELLTKQNWSGFHLRGILEAELEPYIGIGSDRIKITGDDPVLSAKQMLALTLALHELTTNAAKYGALSVPDGTICVSADLLPDHTVELVWQENNGPEVSAPDPAQTGFGSFLLSSVLGPDLSGESAIDYRREGIVWRAAFPLAPPSRKEP